MVNRKVSTLQATGPLHESPEARLRFQADILAHVEDSVIVTDLTGHIVYWNNGATALFGYEEAQMLGQTPALLYPEQDPERLAQDLLTIREGDAFSGEWRALRRDGSYAWVDVKTTLMRDEHGAAIGFVGVGKDVTARRTAEEALRASELRLRLATLATHEAIRDWDLPGERMEWNLGLQTQFGYGKEEPRAEPGWWRELIHPGDRERIDGALAATLAGPMAVWRDEYRFRRSDGTYADVEDVGHIARDASGRAVRMVAALHDITERKRNERRLSFLAEVSRVLVDSAEETDLLLQQVVQLAVGRMADACLVDLVQADGNLRRVAVAPAERALLNEPLLSAVGPGQESPLEAALRTGGAQRHTGLPPLRGDGAGPQSLLVVPIRSQGSTLGVMQLAVDEAHARFSAEDQALAEELCRRVAGALETRRLFHEAQTALALAEQEKRTAETFSRLGLAFASELDRDKLLQRITDEATALTGAAFGAFFHNLINDKGESYLLYTLSGVPRELFAGFPMPRNTKVFGPTFGGQRTVRYDDVTRAGEYGQNPPYKGMPKGHLPVRSYLAVPVKSRAGTVLGGIFFGHPEPGQFRVEHERLVEGLAAQAAVALDNAILYRQAQLAVSVREEFLQIAAHELRTPTTSLKLNVQTLLRGVPPQRLQEKLLALDRNVNQLSVLINELLDVSRITAGNLQLTLEEVDLAPILKEVTGRFEAQALKAGSPLHVSIEGSLVGRWDALRLEQIVTNLLSNALKYGPGRPITVEAHGEPDRVTLVVQDEGIGIDPEDLPRIFGRFERAVSGRHYGGLGLGLYITQKIVEALAGDISVRSEVGKGARFVVQLPRHADARARPSEGAAAAL